MNAYARIVPDMATPPSEPLPHSIEAEQGLLGAILVNNEALSAIAGRIEAADFFEPVHRQIFDVARSLIEAGKVASPVTIKSYLPGDLNVIDLTLNQYLARLAAEATTVINAPDFADTIRGCAIRRGMIAAAQRLIAAAHTPSGDNVDYLVADGISDLDVLLERGTARRGAVTMAAAVAAAVDQVAKAYAKDGALTGVASGVPDLDRMTGGLHAGELTILAARPGMGKSAVALEFAYNAALAGHGVAEFSLEMGHESLALRTLSARASTSVSRLPYFALRSGRINERDFERLADVAVELGKLPFYIDDSASLTISELSSAVRRAAKRLHRAGHPLALVVVDYLQLLRPGDRYSGSKVNEVAEISAGLKRIARDQNVAVLALSQLSRDLEKRDNKRPQLSDLRDSGAIEQDADVVIFLYREEYYLKKQKPPELNRDQFAAWMVKMEACHNKMEIDVAKQRHGPTGFVEVGFDAGTNTIWEFPNVRREIGA